jgi:hypothetical protein
MLSETWLKGKKTEDMSGNPLNFPINYSKVAGADHATVDVFHCWGGVSIKSLNTIP